MEKRPCLETKQNYVTYATTVGIGRCGKLWWQYLVMMLAFLGTPSKDDCGLHGSQGQCIFIANLNFSMVSL